MKKKYLAWIFSGVSMNKLLTVNSLLINQLCENFEKIRNINDLEYKVFSQNGEDGIIDYLLHSLKISKPKFIKRKKLYTVKEIQLGQMHQ